MPSRVRGTDYPSLGDKAGSIIRKTSSVRMAEDAGKSTIRRRFGKFSSSVPNDSIRTCVLRRQSEPYDSATEERHSITMPRNSSD